HGTGDTWIPLANRGLRIEDRESRKKTQEQGPSVDPRSSILNLRFQYKGLFPAIDEASRVSFVYRHQLEHLVGEVPCSRCNGSRLRDDAAAMRLPLSYQDRTNLRLGELCELPLAQTLALFKSLKLPRDQKRMAGELLREVGNSLQCLVDCGVDDL